jgi:hypothetical protein
MHPNIPLGMKLRRLFHALHPRNLGQHLGQQPGLIQQLECPRARPSVSILVNSSRTRSRLTPRSRRPARIAALVPASNSNPNRAANRTPRSIRSGLPQTAASARPIARTTPAPDPPPRPQNQSPPSEVRLESCHPERCPGPSQGSSRPADKIQQQPIDREIPPLHILLGARRIPHRIRMPPIRISPIRPERRHLRQNPSSSSSAAPSATSTTPKCAPTANVLSEQPQHHIRRRARRHVVVLRLASQQQIPHAAAGEVRLIPPAARSSPTIPQSRIELSRVRQHSCLFSPP